MGTITGRWPARSGHIQEVPRKAFPSEADIQKMSRTWEEMNIGRMDFSEIEQRMLANLKPRDRIIMNFHLKRISLPRDDPKRTVLKEVEYMLSYNASAKVARIWYVNRLAELRA